MRTTNRSPCTCAAGAATAALSVLAGTALVVTSGCGASGGRTAVSSSGSGSLSSPVDALRSLQAGDSWQYRLTDENGNTGTAAISLAPDNLSGIVTLKEVNQFDLPVDAGTAPPDLDRDLQQGEIGDLTQIDVSMGGAISYVPLLPGTFRTGLNLSGSTTEGSTSLVTVVAPETVTCSLGTFAAWKVTQTQVTLTPPADGSDTGATNSPFDSRYTVAGTFWYVPQIGNFVKAVYTTTYVPASTTGATTSAGAGAALAAVTHSYTSDLIATSVPH